VHIPLLFTAMTFHGRAPDNLLYSAFVFIPKGNKGNASDSDNFRGIMLSTIFVNLFDNNVLCDNYTRDYSISFKASES
jgi:hypothetical protein